MQRLVSPDLNVYTISGLEALSELVARLRLDSTLASNLREVLACRPLAMVAIKGARWQGTGRGYIVLCAQRRLKHALVPVVGSNAIRIFKSCSPQTPDARYMDF